jgi:hypothetical protein
VAAGCEARPTWVGDVPTPEVVVPVARRVCAALFVGCATVRWCVRWTAGGETTTFSAGAALEPAPARIGGRCTVPESRSRAVAAAPRSSGITGAATRRAITQIASHFPLSLADTGLSSPSLDGPPSALAQGYKKPGRTATRVSGRRSLFPAESSRRRRALAAGEARADTALVTAEVHHARSGNAHSVLMLVRISSIRVWRPYVVAQAS